MLKRALVSLLRSSDGVGVLVVGGVLTLLAWTVTPLWLGGVLLFPPVIVLAPLALAPALVARGYFIRVLVDAAETGNAAGAPPFVAWNRLYRDGVKSAVLSAVLLAPLAMLLGLVAAGAFVIGSGSADPSPVLDPIAGALGRDGVAALGALGVGLVAVTVGVYLVGFAYLRPAALAAFAATGRLRDGLRPRRVGRVAGSGAYATAWVVATVTFLAGYALAGPFVAAVLGVPFVFATRVVVHALYGRGAAETLETRAASVAGADSETAGDDRDEGTVASGAVHEGSSRSPEAPVAVQTGRPIPFGGDIEEVLGPDGGNPVSGESPVDDSGFEWMSAVDGEGVAGDSGDSGDSDDSDDSDDADGTNEASDGTSFDWRVALTEDKDKS
ncbi:DUF4013 domain-containing protein [Halorubrum sp. DTA46]|uniref:DUF4013 domain-containing protein n=1 Tax=Halorubrum sp. DTA46 TaxID=3402162 RepID=UPI003AAC9D49